MTYQEAKTLKANYEARVQHFSAILSAYPKNAMGLTSAKTAEWHSAKRGYDVAFQALRQFNGAFVKSFKREIAAERRVKYAA